MDVAKLNGKRVVSPSVRSTTLRKFDHDDEEDLFGGNRTARSRVSSLVRQTSPEPPLIPAMPRKTSPIMAPQQPIPPAQPVAKQQQPVAKKQQPVVVKQQQPEVIRQPAVVKEPVVVNQVVKEPPAVVVKEATSKPIVEEEDKPSFFASASRFFKSSSNANSKASSTASSIASAQNSPKLRGEPLPQEPKPKPLPKPPLARTVSVPQVEEEETYREIEDEATRAFADDVMSFQSSCYEADYAAIPPDLACMEVVETKRLLPSASTPTTMRAVDVDPWFDGREFPVLGTMEPSVSSPLHRVSVQDIEPEKRNVFADLITSWNTGQTLEPVREEREFFSQVAEEQHIGFASLPPRESTSKNNRAIDYDEEENPWN